MLLGEHASVESATLDFRCQSRMLFADAAACDGIGIGCGYFAHVKRRSCAGVVGWYIMAAPTDERMLIGKK